MMTWERIKEILKKTPGTCIIVEEGKPAFVVISFDEYERSLGKAFPENARENMNEQELLEKINQEITNWKARQIEDNTDMEMEPEEDLKIENLPLV